MLANAEGVRVRDQVLGPGRHRLQWRFTLHPTVEAAQTPKGFQLTLPGAGSLRLETNVPLPGCAIVATEYSRAYGWNEPAHACVAQGDFDLPFSLEWRIA